MNSYLRPRPASLLATAVALVLAQSAAAQTVLGEVTVTARKRAESLQDVPFAISARTGDQLAAAGAQNIEDISRNIAGLTVQNLGPARAKSAYAAFRPARPTATSRASRSRSVCTWTSP